MWKESLCNKSVVSHTEVTVVNAGSSKIAESGESALEGSCLLFVARATAELRVPRSQGSLFRG